VRDHIHSPKIDHGPSALKNAAAVERSKNQLSRDFWSSSIFRLFQHYRPKAGSTPSSHLPAWLYYFGGLADKIEGAVTPIGKSRHGYIAITQMQFDETI
jgi:hypothetical protein